MRRSITARDVMHHLARPRAVKKTSLRDARYTGRVTTPSASGTAFTRQRAYKVPSSDDGIACVHTTRRCEEARALFRCRRPKTVAVIVVALSGRATPIVSVH